MVLVATLALSASAAHAYVYWAEDAGMTAPADHIYRANLDGSGKLAIAGGSFPCGVAVDANYVYWGNAASNTVSRARLDGTDVKLDFITLPPGTGSCGVAVNATQIWWVTLNNTQPDPNNSWIGRANIDGSGVVQRMYNYPQVALPCRLAVNSSHVYWVNNFNGPDIWRAGLDGTPPPTELIGDAAPGGTACSPTLSGSRLFWWSSREGILSSDLDGNAGRVEIGSSAAGGLALLGNLIYWANPLDNTISRANLGGTTPEFGFIGKAKANGLAVDAGVPSNRFSFGKLRRNKKKGTATLNVRVPAPGKLTLRAKGAVKQRPDAAGMTVSRKVLAGVKAVKLRIRAKGGKKRKLERTGSAVVPLRVTYSPTGGTPRTKRRPVVLIQR